MQNFIGQANGFKWPFTDGDACIWIFTRKHIYSFIQEICDLWLYLVFNAQGWQFFSIIFSKLLDDGWIRVYLNILFFASLMFKDRVALGTWRFRYFHNDWPLLQWHELNLPNIWKRFFLSSVIMTLKKFSNSRYAG